MIQGIDAYKRKLQNYSGKLVERISFVFFHLAKQIVNRAVASGENPHETGVQTTLQDNSYVCAVYHDGKLVQGPYVPEGTHEPGVDPEGHSYANKGAEGRRWAMNWGKTGFLASGRSKKKGYEVMIANCAWYTSLLEEGMYEARDPHPWKVISQVYHFLDEETFPKAAQILRDSNGIDISKCFHQSYQI